MIKKSLIVIFLILIFNIEAYAKSSRLALELSRANGINQVIKRVNSIYEYINLFIMQTGRVPINSADLITRYPTIIRNGFNTPTNTPIDFTIANNIITFTNVATGLSPLSLQLYTNNSNLHPMASVITNNLNIQIPLSAQSLQFLGTVNSVESFDDNNISTGKIVISDTEPIDPATSVEFCTINPMQKGMIWYQPDFSGSFILKSCDLVNSSVQWSDKPISNKLDIALTFKDEGRNNIKAPNGTIGYLIENNTSKELIYFYHGTDNKNNWLEVK